MLFRSGAYPDTPDTDATVEQTESGDEAQLETVEQTQSGDEAQQNEEEVQSPSWSPPEASSVPRAVLPLIDPSDDDLPDDPRLRIDRTGRLEEEERRRVLRQQNAEDRFPPIGQFPPDNVEEDDFYREVMAIIRARNAEIERTAIMMSMTSHRAEGYPPHPAHLRRRDYPRHPDSDDEIDIALREERHDEIGRAHV